MDPTIAEQIVARGHLSPGLSFFCMDVVATLGALAVVAVAIRLSRQELRAAARAEASYKPDAALTPGEAVVSGVVEQEPGVGAVVRVEIDQQGSESENSGAWSHKWTEVGRRVLVQPFFLRHASGARIRVEPGEDARLIDEMDGVVRVDLTKRVRVAELLPGETVFVVGELRRVPDPEGAVRGYREKTEGYLLAPSRRRGMLLSSEPLGARYTRRSEFHTRWAVIIAAAFILFHALFASFHARRWLGTTMDVRVTELRHTDAGDDDDRYTVMMGTPDGLRLSSEVLPKNFVRLREGDTIQARVVPSWLSATEIGRDVTVHSRAYLGLLLFALLGIVYRVRASSTRAWYEREKLVEMGSGRLADSKPAPGSRG